MPELFTADAATLAPLNAVMPGGLHPTLREMCEEMFLHLLEDEEVVGLLEVERLAELVVGMVDRVSMKVGGAGFYLPKGIGCKLSARDREIAQAFNGRNKHLLARQYQLSEMRIDQILKKWRQEEFARKQGRLDLGSD